MSKISNCITMIELLSNGRKYSVEELSNRLEVSKRMIRIYKDELEKSGIYIETIKGKYGGYILNQDVRLPKVGFNRYDVELLKNIYNNNLYPNELKNEMISLINKVEMTYQSSKKKILNNFKDNKTEKNKYNIISKCIKSRSKISIDYLSVSGEIKTRIIHPYHLIYYNNEWKLSAFCELRNDLRHFGLNRIKFIKELDEKYD